MMKMKSDVDSKTLYEAAMRGCVATLNTLLRKDQLLLNKVSLTSFTETPLHISSLLGHLDFTIAIVQKCPKMASELDSLKRSPLHLASAEGHTEIVKTLLDANSDVCLVRDQDSRIPLHLAAMRGRVGAIQELVRARPESPSELLDGDTVFHLCVIYNHLGALKLLVEMTSDIDAELISKQNQDGNTLLHLAAMLKQYETVRYVVSEAGEKELVNSRNKMGLTALDVTEQSPYRDLKSYEIRDILMESICVKPKSPAPVLVQPASRQQKESWGRKLMRYIECQGNWIEETRGTLMTVATLIAAMTFEFSIDPPGGVWQQDYRSQDGSLSCGNGDDFCEAGTAVLAYSHHHAYKYLLITNTTAFTGSLIVIFLIISGFPLQNQIMTWVMTVVMCTTVVSTGLTYILSMEPVTPDKLIDQFVDHDKGLAFSWYGMLLVVSLIHIIRFLNWMNNNLRKYLKNRRHRNLLKFRSEQPTSSGQEHNILNLP